jgi:DNA polymerase III epsilon subunit-like protein
VLGDADTLISVDIETDGPVPGLYSILSIGAVVVHTPERRFYRELRPTSDRWVPEALAVSGLDRTRLLLDGAEPGRALAEFGSWATDVGSAPVFCSFSSFDWMFVAYAFAAFEISSPFGHTAVDMKSFYLGAFASRWVDTKMSAIRRDRPSLTLPTARHTHNALDDAIEQGEFFARCLAERDRERATRFRPPQPR